MKHKIFAVCISIFLILFSIGIGVVLSDVNRIMNNYSTISMHDITSKNRSSLLYAKNAQGEWVNIGEIHGTDNRIWVPISKIPKDLQNAFVAIEDQRFYQDNLGIDPKGIIRALIVDIKAGFKPVEGASTITQQLIKNTIFPQIASKKTITRKIEEAILAWKFVHKYSKQQILEAYLNTIYLGGPNLNVYGVQAAALGYFGKNVNQLDLAQSAMIAGITEDPARYSPYANETYAIQRQHLVLQKMLELGFITKSQYEQAINEKLTFKKSSLLSYSHEYFIDQVINDVTSKLEQKYHLTKQEALNKIYNGGLRIFTTMDLNIQLSMENVFSNPKYFPVNSKIKEKVQGAMVVIDWRTGEVKGIVGGRDGENQKLLFNRATQSFRQPGSSIKPLTVYAPALESGLTPASIVSDEPININGWSPHNYENTFQGPVTLTKALADSINIPAVKIVEKIGLNKAAEYGRKFGLDITKNDMYLPALALGGLSHGVSPLQEASAYGAIANGGIYLSPITFTKVEDSNGNVILENAPSERYVMSKKNAYILEMMMEEVVKYGTGINAALPNMPVAGKTGTTDNYDNAWFTGFTPYYVGSVWMGFDSNRRILDDRIGPVVGGTFPAELWKAVMYEIHKNLQPVDFQVPNGISKEYISEIVNNAIANVSTNEKTSNVSQNNKIQNTTKNNTKNSNNDSTILNNATNNNSTMNGNINNANNSLNSNISKSSNGTNINLDNKGNTLLSKNNINSQDKSITSDLNSTKLTSPSNKSDKSN